MHRCLVGRRHTGNERSDCGLSQLDCVICRCSNREHWTANIGLGEDLGFLDEGSDQINAENKDGTIQNVSFRDCHAATSRVSCQLV
jgi:hypothetical protein